MIQTTQEIIERETKSIRAEMCRLGTPLEFIFEGKTPNVARGVARSPEYQLLTRQGYRVKTTTRAVGKKSYDWDKRWSDSSDRYSKFDSDVVFYIPGIQCCGSGDSHVPATLSASYEIIRDNWSPVFDEKIEIYRLGKGLLSECVASLEESQDLNDLVRAEILKEIISREEGKEGGDKK